MASVPVAVDVVAELVSEVVAEVGVVDEVGGAPELSSVAPVLLSSGMVSSLLQPLIARRNAAVARARAR